MSTAHRDLLALALVPGLGPRLTDALLNRFGSAAAARCATVEDLLTVPHIGRKLAADFARALRDANVDAELALLEKHGVRLLARTDPEYPRNLGELPDAPQLLYFRGSILPADERAVAIVGSRQCSSYGLRVAEQLASGLARAGFTVISGLARGIDGCAHRGALDAGGRTLAILAGGLSSIYPPEHVDLSHAVEKSGALISETPMAMAPQRGMFHSRNRLISGLSKAVVIVEANARSGALITARHAADQGRDVFTVPANVDSGFSAGSLQLLRDGAKLIRNVDDLLEDLQAGSPALSPSRGLDSDQAQPQTAVPVAPVNLDQTQQRVWDYLSEPRHGDEIARTLEMAVGALAKTLMVLEMKRLIRRLPGNSYERRQ